MKIAERPKLEEMRLLDLQLYDILDSPEEQEFDDLRELAAQICDCPVSLITLIDRDRQWFKSRQGIEETETSRDLSFCSHAILGDELMVIEDTLKDERFFNNPYVTGEANIRFYAGAPIISPNGQNLGTVCVFDQQPRKLNEQQLRALEILSKQVTKLLELRLKTKLIAERTTQLIKIKDQTVQQFIQERDEENLSVAKELHENIAQELAAGRLYLNMALANETDRLQHMQDADEAIGNALTEVKNLSYSISPTTLEAVSIKDMLENFLFLHRYEYSFTIELKITGNPTSVGFTQAMNCVRIAETWLRVLQMQKEITKAIVKVNVDNDIELCIEDDAVKHDVQEREKNILSSLVYYRVINMNGRIRFGETAMVRNKLCVSFPLIEKPGLEKLAV
ncbi:GAF domain-containing protein [Lacibacter sp.]|uniref:GAF domain-containing protein n=1 Tax=Lacibacter sp. TaxID=1915409 RepID=UPI002B4B92D4|nr:GAF domain-containing protein [Lacibacter sp.]HLP35620.1 GAF domain-containing protein [Lacibacter sp.]